MPDTKFTWRSLREHIRKYFWIYLAGIVICLVGTSLLWTTTRPRFSNEEVVTIYMADIYSDYSPLDGVAQDMLERTRPFDDTLMQVQFQNLQYTDQDYTSQMLLMTRLAVGEGDAFLASPVAMQALVSSQALAPLDDYAAAGWLAEYGLEPYYATVEDEESGESYTYLAGYSLDDVDILYELGAFNNEGAYLCVAMNGGNLETTLKALEFMMEDLMEGKYVGTDAAQPAA